MMGYFPLRYSTCDRSYLCLYRHSHMNSCSLETGGGDYSTCDRSYRCLHRHSPCALALETGGDDYFAVLLNIELDPSLYDLVTLLIRCNLSGNPIDARPVNCIVSLRAVRLDRSIP